MTNTYPMQCDACGHKYVMEMKVSEYCNNKHLCPECGEETRRDFSVGGNIQVNDQTRWRKGEFGGEDRR